MSPRPMDSRNPSPPPSRKMRFKTTKKIHRTETTTGLKIHTGLVDIDRKITRGR